MSQSTEIEYLLTVNTQDCATQIRQLETLLMRTLGLIQRFGLPPEVDAAIEKIQRLIMIIRSLQVTINLFYASSGPIGWGLASLSAITTLYAAADMMPDMTYNYQRGK